MSEKVKQLIDEHYRQNSEIWVKAFCHRIRNGTPQDAEDLVQSIYLRALQYRDSFDEDDGPIGAWMHQIKENTFKDFLADREKYYSALDHSTFPEDREGDCPIDVIDTKEYLDVHIASVRNKEHRKAIKLWLYKGYRVVDLSMVTNLSESSAQNVINDFKSRVKESNDASILYSI